MNWKSATSAASVTPAASFRLASLPVSVVVAALIVLSTAVVVALDPWLLALYRQVVPHWPFLTAAAKSAALLLEQLVVLVGILAYVLVVPTDRKHRLLALAGTVLTQAILVSLLHHLTGRPRPLEVPDRVVFLGPAWRSGKNSFPGGHATAAFALAAVLAVWHPRWRRSLMAAAVLMALSRVHLNKHFFGDCYFGAWLGYWIARCYVPALPRTPPPDSELQGP